MNTITAMALGSCLTAMTVATASAAPEHAQNHNDETIQPGETGELFVTCGDSTKWVAMNGGYDFKDAGSCFRITKSKAVLSRPNSGTWPDSAPYHSGWIVGYKNVGNSCQAVQLRAHVVCKRISKPGS